MDVLHYVFAAALLPVIVFLPGYAVLTAAGIIGIGRSVYAPGLTILAVAALAALGLPTDVSFSVVSAAIVAFLGIATAVAVYFMRRRRVALGPSADERLGLILWLAAYAFLVGFNGIPSNPPGSISPCAPPEPGKHFYSPLNHPGPCALFAPPAVAMTRLPERAQDDLLQFRTAQAIGNRRLFSNREFSGGWRLQDRTPLLGLVTAGLASTGGVSLPVEYPAQPTFVQFPPGPLWLALHGAPQDSSITPATQPKAFAALGEVPDFIDDWGYWFYRLLSMLLNVLIVPATFALGLLIGGRGVAVLSGIAAGVSPAIMQNAYYTSPKYLGVYFGIAAVLLVIERRPAWAGVAVGAAYLCHPFCAVLGGSVVLYQLVRGSIRQAALVSLAALAMVSPWLAFSTATGRNSNLVSYPFGCVGTTVTLETCLDQWQTRPVSEIVWQRATLLPRMVVPASISPEDPLQPASRDGLILKWLTSHDFTFPGMVGFVFFAFVVYAVVGAWRRHARLLWSLVGGQLLAILVLWGVPGWSAWVAGLGLLPFLYIIGATGLLRAPPRVTLWASAFIAAEWLLYLVLLFRPIDGVSLAQYAIGLTLVLGGLGALGFLGARALTLELSKSDRVPAA
jgi:hypothetical protein